MSLHPKRPTPKRPFSSFWRVKKTSFRAKIKASWTFFYCRLQTWTHHTHLAILQKIVFGLQLGSLLLLSVHCTKWNAEIQMYSTEIQMYFPHSSHFSSSGTLVSIISGMISRYSSYIWMHIWIHKSWNVAYEFMIMKSYHKFMIWNHTLIWVHIWISWIHLWIHRSWRILWNHMSKFIFMNSSMNLCCWIHDYAIIEISAMTNIVKSWLNSYKWIHIWNDGWIYWS